MANAHEQDLKIIEFIKKPFDRIKVKFEKLDLSSCKSHVNLHEPKY